MTLSMNGLKSSAAGLFALALVPIAGGCALPGGSTGATPQPAPPPPANSVKIDSPKDAKAVPLCNLLSPQAAQSLGVEPQGEPNENSIDPSQPPQCEWETANDDRLVVGLTVLDRNIARDYYATPQLWEDFAKLDVVGHPTVRANPRDPNKVGSCDLYLATQENQMIASQVILPSADAGKTDGCQIAQRALEAVVPGLPPAK